MSAHPPILVLDVDFLPLRIDHWQSVIADSFLGRLEVVEYSRDRTIKGVSRDYPLPAVVRVLRRFRRDKQAIKFSRLNIYARDAFTCQYCGEQLPSEELTFDHVTPRSRGGRTTWENIVTCCVPCNAQKADRTPLEAGVELRRRPVKPRWLPAVTVAMERHRLPPEWAAYWSGTLHR